MNHSRGILGNVATEQASASPLHGECVVPDCKMYVLRRLAVGVDFPICVMHMVAIWEQVEVRSSEPWFEPAVTALKSRQEIARREWREAEAREDSEWRADLKAGRVLGDIYFIRANGLVKVGWSSNLESRLRSYGPDIEVLCHYQASREDETHLHRQLRPYLAKGREWYSDCRLIDDLVEQAIAQHGQPMGAPRWTEPKGSNIRPKAS